MAVGMHWKRKKFIRRLELHAQGHDVHAKQHEEILVDQSGYVGDFVGTSRHWIVRALISGGDSGCHGSDCSNTQERDFQAKTVCDEVLECECDTEEGMFSRINVVQNNNCAISERYVEESVASWLKEGHSERAQCLVFHGVVGLHSIFASLALKQDSDPPSPEYQIREEDLLIRRYVTDGNRVLLLPKDCVLDFHFGGSVGHPRRLCLLSGSMICVMVPPTRKNLQEYTMWYPTKDTCFLDFVEGAVCAHLYQPEQMLSVPAGWLVAYLCVEKACLVEHMGFDPMQISVYMDILHCDGGWNSSPSCVHGWYSIQGMRVLWRMAQVYGDAIINLIASKDDDLKKELNKKRIEKLQMFSKTAVVGHVHHGGSERQQVHGARSHLPPINTLSNKLSFIASDTVSSPRRVKLRVDHGKVEQQSGVIKLTSVEHVLGELRVPSNARMPNCGSVRLEVLQKLAGWMHELKHDVGHMEYVRSKTSLELALEELAILYPTEKNPKRVRNSGSMVFTSGKSLTVYSDNASDEDLSPGESCGETPKASELHYATPFSSPVSQWRDDDASPNLQQVLPKSNNTKKQASLRPKKFKSGHYTSTKRLAKKLSINAE
jgi:hypothetical protein